MKKEFSKERERVSWYAMKLSFVVAIVMLLGKIGAYLLTGSTAILSDAAESVVHIVGTAVSAICVRIAAAPPDSKHPYGHDRIIVFSIGLEGALIFSAAIVILIEAVREIIKGPELQQLGLGLSITAALSVINLILGLYLVNTGRRYNAPVLKSNGEHVLTDMWTSLALLMGVGVVWATGIYWLDPFIAILAAFHIIYTGLKMMRQAASAAMDEVDDEATSKINQILDEAINGNLITSYHQLRHREVNSNRWIEVHLLVDRTMSIVEAHDRATNVEKRLRSAFPKEKVRITSHIEPNNHTEVHPRGHDIADPLASFEK